MQFIIKRLLKITSYGLIFVGSLVAPALFTRTDTEHSVISDFSNDLYVGVAHADVPSGGDSYTGGGGDGSGGCDGVGDGVGDCGF